MTEENAVETTRLKVVRFEQVEALHAFRVELKGLVSKYLKFARGANGIGEGAAEGIVRRIEQALGKPEVGLWLLMDAYPRPVGFMFGRADVRRKTFDIALWYVKCRVAEKDGDKELFAAVKLYCKAAGLDYVSFAIAGSPPTRNPVYDRFAEEFKLRPVLTALIGEVK